MENPDKLPIEISIPKGIANEGIPYNVEHISAFLLEELKKEFPDDEFTLEDGPDGEQTIHIKFNNKQEGK